MFLFNSHRYTKIPSGGYMQPEEQYFCMNHPYNVRTTSRCQCPLSRCLSAAQRTAYDPDLCPSCCSTNATGICSDSSCSSQHVLTTGRGHENTCCRQQHLLTTNPDHGSACPHQPLHQAAECLHDSTGFSLEVVTNSCNCCGSDGVLACPGFDASQHTTIGCHISSNKSET